MAGGATPLEKLIGEDVNILLVCPSQDVLKIIQKTILSCTQSQAIPSRVHLCFTLKDLIERSGGKLHEQVDFIIFIALSENSNSLDKIVEDLESIETVYPRSRMCIACLDLNYSTPVLPDQVWAVAKRYQLNLLMGSVAETHKAQHLCERILRLMKVGCGFNGVCAHGTI